MSVLFGSGPDIDEQKRLEQQASSTLAGANPNVGLVDFGQSAMGGFGPEGRNAQLAAIQGYRDILNAPGGLDARGRAAMMEGQGQAAQQTAATLRGLAEQRARTGASSAGEEAAQQAIAASEGANTASRAGLEGAALGEEARLGAMAGATGAGSALRGADVSQARTQDAFTLMSKEAQQRQMEQNFQNALAKAHGQSGLMSDYDKTKAGGGYGLLGNGLLSAQNIGTVAGAMTGGLGSLAGMVGGGLSSLLGGGGSAAANIGEDVYQGGGMGAMSGGPTYDMPWNYNGT